MSLFSTKAIDIKLVGPNLVAAFHRAQPPLVWRFDLERNHSFTIALQGDEGDWEIGITSAKGEFYPIVHFTAREDAEEALTSVQKILMKRKGSKLWCALKMFLLLIVLCIILLGGGLALFIRAPFLSASLPSVMMRPPAPTMVAPPPAVQPMPAPAFPSGIPLPADDVLKPPK